MSKVVVDSCVAIKWLVDEPDTPAARELLVSCVAGGTQILAPDLIQPEIGNILWKKARRQLITADQLWQAFDHFKRLPLTIVPSIDLLDDALQIALGCEQSPYDCLYVALSQREHCRLVTTDEPLVRKVSGLFSRVVLLNT